MLRRALCERRLEPTCPPLDVELEGCLSYEWDFYGFEDAGRTVDEGRARIDDAALEACLAVPFCGATPEVCGRVFVGLGASGAGCTSSAACRPEFFCERSVGESCGRCVPDRAPGEACSSNDACLAADLAPSERPSCIRSSLFAEGICGIEETREGVPGGSCGWAPDGPERTVRTQCPSPAVCTTDGSTSSCATEPGLEGAPCAPGFNLCAAGLLCELGGCVRALELGAPCSSTPAPATPTCDRVAGLVCLAGACEPIPDEPGDACGWTCASGLYCIGGMCEPAGPLGAACLADSHCLTGRCGARGVCEATPVCR